MQSARLTPLPFLLLAACGVEAELPIQIDPADRTSWAFFCEPEPGRIVAPGMSYGDGCNQCYCNDPTTSGAPQGICTAAACQTPVPNVPAAYPACTSDSDCGAQGSCIFDAGCTNPVGTCVQVQLNPDMGTASSYCTCDGRTIDKSTPTEPYAYAGPC